MPVLDELEAALLRDPDDLEAYAVYGDYLAERGDPRGELIATQLAAAQSNDPEMTRAALRVFARHRELFIGELGSMIAADAFTWRAGFIQRAVLSQDRLLIENGELVATSLAEVADKLFVHRSARFLTELVVRLHAHNPSRSQKDLIDTIARARPGVLRRLHLGETAYGTAILGRLEPLWPALPALDELVIEGQFELGRAVLPTLRSLSLHPRTMGRRLAREVVEAELPALRSFSLHLGNSSAHITREIIALVQRDDLQALRHLGLIAYQNVEEIVYQLVRSPVLARLETLDLRHAKITERAVRQILKNAVAFEHLARIDLTQIALPASTLADLQRRLPNLVGDSS